MRPTLVDDAEEDAIDVIITRSNKSSVWPRGLSPPPLPSASGRITPTIPATWSHREPFGTSYNRRVDNDRPSSSTSSSFSSSQSSFALPSYSASSYSYQPTLGYQTYSPVRIAPPRATEVEDAEQAFYARYYKHGDNDVGDGIPDGQGGEDDGYNTDEHSVHARDEDIYDDDRDDGQYSPTVPHLTTNTSTITSPTYYEKEKRAVLQRTPWARPEWDAPQPLSIPPRPPCTPAEVQKERDFRVRLWSGFYAFLYGCNTDRRRLPAMSSCMGCLSTPWLTHPVRKASSLVIRRWPASVSVEATYNVVSAPPKSHRAKPYCFVAPVCRGCQYKMLLSIGAVNRMMKQLLAGFGKYLQPRSGRIVMDFLYAPL